MNYAYLRVSTDKQDAENQKLGILEYAVVRNVQIDTFVEDVVSGTRIGKNVLWEKLFNQLKQEMY